jgi:hypothetical protein
MERCQSPDVSSTQPSGSTVKEPPPGSLHKMPIERDTPPPEPRFNYQSKSKIEKNAGRIISIHQRK